MTYEDEIMVQPPDPKPYPCNFCGGYGWVAEPDPNTGEPINPQPCQPCNETGWLCPICDNTGREWVDYWSSDVELCRNGCPDPDG